MARTDTPIVDFYERMVRQQTTTNEIAKAGVSLQQFLRDEGQGLHHFLEGGKRQRTHDQCYGVRVVESFKRAQEAERTSYFDAVQERHLQTLDRISAEQYLTKMRLHGCLEGERCRVIDLCCGSGNIIAKMVEQATLPEKLKLHFLGIDINDEGFRRAQEAFVSTPNVQFLRANVLGRLRGVEQADVILCHTAMHEFPQPHLLLRAATRLALQLVIVKDLLRPAIADFWHLARQHGANYRGQMFRLFCESLKSSLSAEEMQALAQRMGYTFELCPPIYGILTRVMEREGRAA